MTKPLDPHPYTTSDFDGPSYRVPIATYRSWSDRDRIGWYFSPRPKYEQDPSKY